MVLVAANGFGSLFVKYSGRRRETGFGGFSLRLPEALRFRATARSRMFRKARHIRRNFGCGIRRTAPQQISHLNDSWKQFTLSAPEYYKYKSFDGVEIEAALLAPARRRTPKPNCRLSL